MVKEERTPWHDDNIFWEKMLPFMFKEEKFQEAQREVSALIELLDIKPDEHILDLSCGLGRHSNEFARRGFTVTGVDRTKLYLQHAKTTAQNEGLSVDFIESDMREFKKPNGFDVVLSLYTSFGFFEDNSEQSLVLQNIFSSLKSGGRFVMQSMGKEILARIFNPKSWHEEAGLVQTIEREIIDDWERIHNVWTLIEEDGTRYTWDVTHYIYSAAEFKTLLE
jgi:cyclopropane fatty-acyl-phospholipid synthase-like methyltransferase